MSYGEEATTEMMMSDNLLYLRAEQRAAEGIWTLQGGKMIKVTDMTTEHIKNCLRMIRHISSPNFDPYIGMFEKELERRSQ